MVWIIGIIVAIAFYVAVFIWLIIAGSDMRKRSPRYRELMDDIQTRDLSKKYNNPIDKTEKT